MMLCYRTNGDTSTVERMTLQQRKAPAIVGFRHVNCEEAWELCTGDAQEIIAAVLDERSYVYS